MEHAKTLWVSYLWVYSWQKTSHFHPQSKEVPASGSPLAPRNWDMFSWCNPKIGTKHRCWSLILGQWNTHLSRELPPSQHSTLVSMYKRIINQETTGWLAAPSSTCQSRLVPRAQDSQHEPACSKEAGGWCYLSLGISGQLIDIQHSEMDL